MNPMPLCGMNTLEYHGLFRHLFNLVPRCHESFVTLPGLKYIVYYFIVSFHGKGGKQNTESQIRNV